MKTTLPLLGLAGILLSLSAGCGAATPTSRLVVHQEHAAIVIEGRGTVEGGGLACGSEAASTCTRAFQDVWATVLDARPSPGWRFAGWDRTVRNRKLAPGAPSDETTVYTARFERETSKDVAGSVAAGR